MGVGVGPLPTAADVYQFALIFDGNGIPMSDPIYTHFKSAVEWLL